MNRQFTLHLRQKEFDNLLVTTRLKHDTTESYLASTMNIIFLRTTPSFSIINVSTIRQQCDLLNEYNTINLNKYLYKLITGKEYKHV